jgi:DNA-binding XRE family transcriptional regulator
MKKSYKTFKQEILRNKEVARVYQELGPEFLLIQKLIAKRQKHGLSQSALAKKIGTKQSAISRFESGDYNPSLQFLFKIADALDAEIKISVA